MFGSRGIGHMSIIENWIQSEDENDMISREKMLQMEASMTRRMKNGVLGKNNNSNNVSANCFQNRELVSNKAKKALLDRIDMDHQSNDSTESVVVQEKELRAIQEPDESNIYPDVNIHNKIFDYQATSLREIDQNDELFKTPQMVTRNICNPLLNGAASKFLEDNTTSEVDHLLDDDEAAANLYLEFLKSSQPNLAKSSTNSTPYNPLLSPPKCLIEGEIIPLEEQNQHQHHIVDSAVERHDTANDGLCYSDNANSKQINLQNNPASVSGIYPKDQTPLVFHCSEQTHRNFQSETTGFSQGRSHKQYSKFQVDGDSEDHFAVDNETLLAPHSVGMTPINVDDGKEITASHESGVNQRNVAPEPVNTSGAASTPSHIQQAAESLAQPNNTLNNEIRLATENMNLYQYSLDLYTYLMFSEIFKSQILYLFSQTINGTNNLNQLILLAREMSTNQQSVNHNSTPQTRESKPKSPIPNNEKHDRTCQDDSAYSGNDQIGKGNVNIIPKKVMKNIGRKRFHVGVLRPGLQNTSKCRKRPQASTAISKPMIVKRFKNKENHNKDEYEIENLDNSSPERWIDAVPRKIDFGPSKTESCRTPKRPSKYIRNKKK